MGTINSINATNVNNSLLVGTGSAYTSLATANNGTLITSAGGVPSISSTLPSGVQTNITSVGTVTAGTWNASTIAINKGGTNATSFTQTNGIVTYNGTSLVNYAGPQIDSSGRYTNTTQPAFYAAVPATTANVTGDGTVYTIVFTSEQYDQGNIFNGSTTCTAPVTGKYLFTCTPSMAGLTASHTDAVLNLVTTAATYSFWELSAAGARTNSNGLRLSGAIVVPMTAADTATLTMQVSNGTKVVSFQNIGSFAGTLLI